MTQEYEQDAQPEAEHPAYLDHWTRFAEEQIALENSPIRESEQDKFRNQCAKNASLLAGARESMLNDASVTNVYDWYARLGSVATLEGAESDLTFALHGTLRSPEATARDDDTLLLGGSLAAELGLLHTGKDAEGYFVVASKVYGTIINKYGQDLNQPAVRKALAHSYDVTFARLTAAQRDGLITPEQFEAQYFDRHREYVALCHKLASDRSIDVPDGEMYEFYGETLLRHKLWARERFGEAEVRRSFSPREDKSRDDFNYGNSETRADPLPSYKFDLKLSVVANDEAPRFIQLKKAGQGVRYAKPAIAVAEYRGEEPLKVHVTRMTEIMAKSYRFESTEREEAELEDAYTEAQLVSV